jgi:predicted enzyme related to lactoylglutathione lyase
MPNDLAHFAIQVDDTQRAIRFYESVFGWNFQPWGPPGFWMIYTSPGAPTGSL